MTRKTYNITLTIELVLCIATLIFAFLCEFNIAFILMIATGAYGMCLNDAWNDTRLDGFDDDNGKMSEDYKENDDIWWMSPPFL